MHLRWSMTNPYLIFDEGPEMAPKLPNDSSQARLGRRTACGFALPRAPGNPWRSSILFSERLQRGREAAEWRAYHARPDLTDAGLAARDARVDRRRDGRLDHEPRVHAHGAAAVVEGRDAEVRVLAGADLAHLRGHRRGLRRAAGAEEARDGGRGHHRKRAEADRLDDRAVAHVGIRVAGTEAGEVETLRHVHGRGEPAIAAARDADAEVGAVARHDRHE